MEEQIKDFLKRDKLKGNKIKMESLICLFCTLAQIPSPSLQEQAVAEKIVKTFQELCIDTYQDSYGNVYAKIPATDETKQPLMLSAHMDVVGDASPVKIVFSKDKKIIETDKKRTLGADDKAGVTQAIWLAKTIKEDSELKHGGLEIVFTRDEEQGMSGINNVEFNKLNSQYILVLDSDKLGKLEVSGAGYTKMLLAVKTYKGGHSGMDIQDKSRVNAVNLISEIITKLPSGVYKKDRTGTITSLNAGAIVAGGVKNIDSDKSGAAYSYELAQNAMDNIINTDAYAVYSIRSSDVPAEQKLCNEIIKTIEKFNKKYKGLAEVNVTFKTHLKPFERANDNTMIEVAQNAANKCGVKLQVSSFHAGAETHVYANKKNSKGQQFKPYLAGVADIYNMHSPDEKLDVASMEKGAEFLKNIFYQFNGAL